ncbi:MAG: 8-oxoguanine DNA glycosylase [Geobacter sp.]|nr:MAG: 8-oxoguanine DNA glycosylase [Geobacter sp.]
MAQTVLGIIGGEVRELLLPDPSMKLMEGVVWGEFDVFFTPAFWAVQAWLDSEQSKYSSYKLGTSLQEEVAACLLGGHGIPSEVGLAAYKKVKEKGLLTKTTLMLEELISVLREPLQVGERQIQYRFWKQKSHYLCESLKAISKGIPSCDDHKVFRNWLVDNLPGVGPKTASWITRNWLSSNDVAIIDIHIQRAGLYAGFFEQNLSVTKNYYLMEDRFLRFASALDIMPAMLDTLIWRQMKDFGSASHKVKLKHNDPVKQPALFNHLHAAVC